MVFLWPLKRSKRSSRLIRYLSSRSLQGLLPFIDIWRPLVPHQASYIMFKFTTFSGTPDSLLTKLKTKKKSIKHHMQERPCASILPYDLQFWCSQRKALFPWWLLLNSWFSWTNCWKVQLQKKNLLLMYIKTLRISLEHSESIDLRYRYEVYMVCAVFRTLHFDTDKFFNHSL